MRRLVCYLPASEKKTAMYIHGAMRCVASTRHPVTPGTIMSTMDELSIIGERKLSYLHSTLWSWSRARMSETMILAYVRGAR